MDSLNYFAKKGKLCSTVVVASIRDSSEDIKHGGSRIFPCGMESTSSIVDDCPLDEP